MGCGGSKVAADPNAAFKGKEQFNIRKALSVGELLEQGEALNGKRVLVVGRAKNAGQVLQTPFGERNALAAEIVGYTNSNKWSKFSIQDKRWWNRSCRTKIRNNRNW